MNGWGYLQLICATVGILGIIFLLFWLLRKVNKGVLTTGGKRLKILDRATLGGEKSILVISVAGRCMVVGVTAGKISKIDDIDLTEEEYLAMLYPDNENKNKDGSFFSAFTDALGKNINNIRGNLRGENQEDGQYSDGQYSDGTDISDTPDAPDNADGEGNADTADGVGGSDGGDKDSGE